MELQTITIKGESFVLIPRVEYDRLLDRDGGMPLPALPERDKSGNVPALAFLRASIARQIVHRMNAAGISQAELARRSGVPRETLNRILKCNRTPDEATVAKIERALRRKLPKAN